ncbi:ABC-type nitrate/sulfonate/bicarbonate transport system, periplasmic component [Beggiatoa alba B18LD]|uniref:ABC-type nitrate/sulfonate/bicarbonate transport system, periplasmic component n=1 Tax=Beggiatoa alba B18LD TaxID=395493 RepID=I3CD32_9GAMM|nr:ABC transporter substrate-binding protein [Beggiatoa alba]EIJ41525.1 ABC-type nitrate/sulfonate/bicarbonate transport system, periplasmic component [Beggiatoa alba B18LD]
MMIKKIIRWTTGIILSGLLVACSEDNTPTPLRIGTNFWAGYEPLYLARSLNYLDDNKVRLVENSSTSQSLRNFLDKHIEGAALTLDEVLALQQTNTDACIVLVMDISEGADAILGKPSLQNLQGLKGARIGVENTAVGAYTLARALEFAKLNVTDVTIVSLEADKHEFSYLSNQVDAVVTFEPIRSHLLAAHAIQLFDSSQISGEIVDVLIMQKSYLDKYPQQIKYVVDNWFNALDYFKQHNEDAITHMAPRMKLPVADVMPMYKGLTLPDRQKNRQLLSKTANNPEPLRQTLRQLNTIMLAQKLIKKSVDVDQICIYNHAL